MIPEGYKQSEVGVIPEDWEIKSVAELASPTKNAIVGGPFGSDLVSNDYTKSGIPVIRGQNMGARFVDGDFVFVSKEKAKLLKANTAGPNDLVFTQRGTMGQVSLVRSSSETRFVISQSQMKVTFSDDLITPEFALDQFSSSQYQRIIEDSTIQTGVPHINLGILKAYKLPVPTKAEQEAIAEALSDADALIESLEQLIAKKRLIKQGAMQELLTGKKRLPGFEGEWEEKMLGDMVDPDRTIRYGIVQPGKFDQNGRLMVRGQDYSRGWVEPSEMFRVSPSVEEPFKNARLKAGDILITIVGASTGKVEIVPLWLNGANLTQTTARIAVKGEIAVGTFCAYFLQSELGQHQVGDFIKGAAQPGLNCGDIEKFRIQLPSTIEEQAAIANILTDMDDEIAVLEAKLAKARQIKQGMMQELLTGKTRLV